ncbi:hypothetical protein CPB97_000921 [Podila verticillata]|nr:hypothetical protein CPB97_000921 [Podila verticillata]
MEDGLHRRRGSTSSQSDSHPTSFQSTTSTQNIVSFNPDHLRPQYNHNNHLHNHNHNHNHNNHRSQHDSSEFIPLTLINSFSPIPTPDRSDNSLASLGHTSPYAVQVRVIGNPSEPCDNKIFASDDQASGSRSTGITSIPPHPTTEGQSLQQENSSKPTPNSTSKRLQSLDILRGVTIVLMILVNTQGAEPFVQLEHPAWFGFHLADWVFPNFIFMVGMAVAIVFAPVRVAAMIPSDSSGGGASDELAIAVPSFWKHHRIRINATIKILKRSLILFAMGLVLNAFELIGEPASDHWLRIPGVLQRIAFCYCALATTVLWAPLQYKHGESVLQLSLYATYGLPIVFTALWFILTYSVRSTATVPIDECEYPSSAYILPDGSRTTVPQGAPSRGQISSPMCTAQSYLDTLLFGRGHDPNNPMFDAEGTLGSLMAVVTAWFGWITGTWVVEQQRLQKANDQRLTVIQPTTMTQVFEWSAGLGIANQEPDGTHPFHGGANNQQWIEYARRRFLLSYLGEWFMVGVCVMFAGAILDWFLPNMKALWTPSYTLYTAGISINVLCLLMYIYDLPSVSSSSTEGSTPMPSRFWAGGWHVLPKAGRFATRLLICYGRNPTLIYMMSETVQILLGKIPATDRSMDWVESVWAWIFFNTFFKIMSPTWASICFSVMYILLFAPLLWFLDCRGWYLRV